MGSPKYVVRFMLNRLLCDPRARGESMRLLSEDAFNTEECYDDNYDDGMY